MPFDTTVFAGIDLSGGRKPFTYAALDGRGHLLALADGEMDDALAFLGGLQAAQVAINAPARPNLGLVSLHGAGRRIEMRLAEQALRDRGINVAATPARRELCPAWVQDGFEFYRRLDALGFAPHPAPDSPRKWMETHPQACFAVFAGGLPLPKPTLEGRLQRQLLLYERGLGIRDGMDFFEELTRHKLLKGILPMEFVYMPEQLDALAAAATAWLVATRPADVCLVGDPLEGQVLLPARELKEKYS
jgi:hypothetical protein